MNEITYLHLLSAETMLSNSYAWLNNPDIVQAVENHPVGAGLFTEMRSAHGDLTEAMHMKQHLSTRLMQLTQTITTTDGIHDRTLRSMHNLLTGLAEATDDPAEATILLAARDTLFPQGLAQTRQTYAQEHGAVVKSEERMTPDLRQLLEQTVVGSRSLWALYRRWVAAGIQLGELIKERARVAESSMLRADGSPIHVREARNSWLQVMRVFIGAVSLLGLSKEVELALFAPLRRDVSMALAAMRARAEDGAPESLPDGDDLPDGGDEPLPDAPAPGGDAAVL